MKNRLKITLDTFEIKGQQFTLTGLLHSENAPENIQVFLAIKGAKEILLKIQWVPTPPGFRSTEPINNRWNYCSRFNILGDMQVYLPPHSLENLRLCLRFFFKGKSTQQLILTFNELTRASRIRVLPGNPGPRFILSQVKYYNNRTLLVTGCCYHEVKVEKIVIFINHRYRGKFPVNVSRLDVYEKFADCKHSNCGFKIKRTELPVSPLRLVMKFYSANRLVCVVGQEFPLAEIHQGGENQSFWKIRLTQFREHLQRLRQKCRFPLAQPDQDRDKQEKQAEHITLSRRLAVIRNEIKALNSRGVLIYCPDITGHRHLYSAYFIRYFLKHHCVVYFFYAGRIDSFLRNGKVKYDRVESTYLEIYKELPEVYLIDICQELNDVKNELDFIVMLQNELKPAVSLFVDGDILKYTFLKQVLPWKRRLRENSFSHICLSEFLYLPRGRFQLCRELGLFIRFYITNRSIFLNRVFFVERFPLLNILFFRWLGRYKLLTAAFCPDEHLINHFQQKRVLFLPELDTGSLQVKPTAKEASFYARIKSQYRNFLRKHSDKHVLLMFGDLEFRKGYDLLLQLGAHNPDCVCVRFGRTKPGYYPIWQTVLSKEKLLLEDRLFEVDIYLESQDFIDFVFSTVTFMVLPYRKYYRTSGVLIEVLRRGLPVLTSNKGVMAHIVKKYQVGRVFRDGDFQVLQKEFSDFKCQYKDYKKNIDKFNLIYSGTKIEETLAVMLK
jgi:hypothetical protein